MVHWLKKLWLKLKHIPFVEPRLGALYGIFTGVFLSLAVELLVKPLTNEDSSWSYLQIAGGIFLAASFMLGMITFRMEVFHSFLERQGAVDKSIDTKIGQLKKWGNLKIMWIYLTLFLIFLAIGIIILFIKPCFMRY